MIKLIPLILFIISCTPKISEEDRFELGKEVPTPSGCIELRERGGEC